MPSPHTRRYRPLSAYATQRAVIAATLIATASLLSACETVQAWERGHLAKPQAALQAHPTQRALRDHQYSSREASAGGQSAEGGGCGCY